MEERNAIVRRLFTQAATSIGSRARLAAELGIAYDEVGRYMAGEAIPPDGLASRVAALLGDDLPRIRAGFSSGAWRALKLPD
jgi:hypothetical protein